MSKYPQLTLQQCAQFLSNPNINPTDPTKRLMANKGPYNDFVRQCGKPNIPISQYQMPSSPFISSSQLQASSLPVGNFSISQLGMPSIGGSQHQVSDLSFPQSTLPNLPSIGNSQPQVSSFQATRSNSPSIGGSQPLPQSLLSGFSSREWYPPVSPIRPQIPSFTPSKNLLVIYHGIDNIYFYLIPKNPLNHELVSDLLAIDGHNRMEDHPSNITRIFNDIDDRLRPYLKNGPIRNVTIADVVQIGEGEPEF